MAGRYRAQGLIRVTDADLRSLQLFAAANQVTVEWYLSEIVSMEAIRIRECGPMLAGIVRDLGEDPLASRGASFNEGGESVPPAAGNLFRLVTRRLQHGDGA